jgi:hypothetical protein
MLRVALTVALFGLGIGTASAHPSTVRIFDPAGEIKAQLTTPDVIRRSVKAGRLPGDAKGFGSLTLTFTSRGERSFCALTKALAKRSKLAGVPEEMAFAVNGRVYKRPSVDFRASPGGFCTGPPIIEFDMPLQLAQRLARIIRDD